MRTESVLCRLTREEREDLELLQRQLQAATPWAKITMSDALRHALASAVAAAPVGLAVKPGTQMVLDEDQEQQAPRKRKKKENPPPE